jgi:hypothetical protein
MMTNCKNISTQKWESYIKQINPTRIDAFIVSPNVFDIVLVYKVTGQNSKTEKEKMIDIIYRETCCFESL